MSRREELAAGLADVEERIGTACVAAGRARDDVTLIVVTKTYPASDVALLAELGVRDVGENRHPEAGRKAEELAELAPGGPRPRWHFVGALQTNKTGPVARYADVVQSVDRPKLVHSLAASADRAERKLSCLIQVDFGDDPHRSGVSPDDAEALAAEVAGQSALRLAGVMTVAPLDVDPRPVFARLRELSDAVRAAHPQATWISAGMSADLEAAIAEGATHLRVGSAVLGERRPPG